MTKPTVTSTQDIYPKMMPPEWQQAYLEGMSTASTTWLDFMGERFHAYAHVIDDISHCHDLNEAWRIQSTFGQETAKAYTEQAAKLGGMVLRVTSGDNEEKTSK